MALRRRGVWFFEGDAKDLYQLANSWIWKVFREGCDPVQKQFQLKGLILAQNERWRRGLGMQVAREM